MLGVEPTLSGPARRSGSYYAASGSGRWARRIAAICAACSGMSGSRPWLAARRVCRVRIGVGGESWVFAPGPVGESVDSPGLGLADALLRSPAAGKRRYSTSIPAPSKEPTDFHAFNLPQGLHP